MADKRAMTLSLSDDEMKVLDELALKKDLTKSAVIRQAIRLYYLVDARLGKGAKLLFEDDATNQKSELMLL